MHQLAESGECLAMGLRSDPAGDGRYLAPRGSRTHRGVDFECMPGQVLVGGVSGTVTKHGYCYSDDLTWRYVQVTDFDGVRHRFFYVEPLVPVGEVVGADTAIGVAQDITGRYPDQGMLPHVHYEVKSKFGSYLNPGVFLAPGSGKV